MYHNFFFSVKYEGLFTFCLHDLFITIFVSFLVKVLYFLSLKIKLLENTSKFRTFNPIVDGRNEFSI